jgi:uncharacterized protein (TIGR02996 family)
VSEDDALLRTVIDRPGDDTARLVYADWLDERDDPRGPFLRAEVEWARTRSEGRALRARVTNLDPVWVARVSRPPIGVCCDHFTFTDCGPRQTPDSIDTAEALLGCTLPVPFRAFLLNYNAGRVVPLGDAPAEHGIALCEDANEFFPLDRVAPEGDVADLLTLTEHIRALDYNPLDANGPRVPIERLLPLAATQLHTDIVFLGIAGAEFGAVYLFHNFQTYWYAPEQLELVAESLPEFLARLEPQWLTD